MTCVVIEERGEGEGLGVVLIVVVEDAGAVVVEYVLRIEPALIVIGEPRL